MTGTAPEALQASATHTYFGAVPDNIIIWANRVNTLPDAGGGHHRWRGFPDFDNIIMAAAFRQARGSLPIRVQWTAAHHAAILPVGRGSDTSKGASNIPIGRTTKQ